MKRWRRAPGGTERWRRVYHCRDIEDENVVVSFGFFEGDLEELRETQERMGRENQVSSIEPYVDETLLDGAYEVIEELTSYRPSAAHRMETS